MLLGWCPLRPPLGAPESLLHLSDYISCISVIVLTLAVPAVVATVGPSECHRLWGLLIGPLVVPGVTVEGGVQGHVTRVVQSVDEHLVAAPVVCLSACASKWNRILINATRIRA